MKKPFLPLLFLAIPFIQSSSQTKGESAFILANIGAMRMQSDKFQDVCGSRILPHFGVGLGFVFSTQKYVYGRFSYHTKRGTVSYYDYSFGGSAIRHKDVIFEEFVVDAGLGLVATTNQVFNCGLLIGAAYVHVSEGALSFAAEAVDSYGPKGSFYFELPFEDIGSSLSLEVGILFTLGPSRYSPNEFGGYDASIAYRFYFGK